MQKLIIQNTKETIYYHVLPQIKKTVFSTGNCLLFIITYIFMIINALSAEAAKAHSVWTHRLSVYNQLLFVVYDFTLIVRKPLDFAGFIHISSQK